MINSSGAGNPSPTTPGAPRRLLVMDVDSTFFSQEVIELLAAHCGAEAEVAEITEAAMRGELDFKQSLERRVRVLAGLPDRVFAQVRELVRLSPGAAELVAEAHRRGWVVALVSGGFTEIVAPIAAEHGISRVHANTLEVSGGLLTGRTVGPVIDREAKEQHLRRIAAEEGIEMSDTVAIGDGANDLAMIGAAGIGIAFNAKPIVRDQAPHVIEGSLDRALDIIDRV